MILKMHFLFTAVALMTSLILSASLHAQTSVTDGVLINADSMFRDLTKKTVRLKGNVQVVFKGQHLSCDKAMLNLQTQQITAEGHVILYNEKAHVEGDRIVFNYHENTGFIYNGFVQSGQVVFQGEVVEKIGEDHYLATNAEYTACETCPPGWSFSGRKIDAEIGGYARIQRPVFRIGGVPILILPSLIVPLKSARQSGVLVPSMDFSQKGGVALSGIYFWAIDRSQDVTLTARWYKLRGYKILEDYRYVLSKDSYGHVQGAYMEDKRLHEDYSFPSNGNIDRWFLNYDHYQDLPNGFVHRADIRQVSDLRYTRDFPEEIQGHGDSALENKMSITKTTENQYSSVEADYYTNLLKNYPVQPNEDAVHRFPEIRYSYKERRLLENGPLVRFDLDYTNFTRDRWNYDDLILCSSIATNPVTQCPSKYVPAGSHLVTKSDGSQVTQVIEPVGARGEVYHDGNFSRAATTPDLWRTGQRLDLQPTVSYPFQILRKVDLIPSVTYRETQYRFNVTQPTETTGFESTAERRYVQTDIKAKTEFSRVFGDLNDPKSERWKHSIEPEFGYSQIPWMKTPNHPFFGDYRGLQYSRQYEPISDTDIGNPSTGVQFDYNDRTFERRVVNYTIDNRITRKFWVDGTPDYRTVTLFRIGQSYDFNEAQRDKSHPWSSIDSLLDMRFEHFETLTTASYNPYAHKTNTSARLRGMVTPKNFVQLGYTQNFILDQDYALTPGGETRTYGVGGGFVSRYFEMEGQVDFSDITHQVNGWRYGLNIRPPGRCWVIHVDHTYVLNGDPQIHASLNFDFGGETTSEVSTRSQAIN